MPRRLALPQETLHQLVECITRFYYHEETSFAAFSSIFHSLAIARLLTPPPSPKGMPPHCERAHTALLLHAAAAHAADGPFQYRLGGLFLLHSLYLLQRPSPRMRIPISEEEWSGMMALADELRQQKHAQGFRALHTLWTSDAFCHKKVAVEDVPPRQEELEPSLHIGFAAELSQQEPVLSSAYDKYAQAMGEARASPCERLRELLQQYERREFPIAQTTQQAKRSKQYAPTRHGGNRHPTVRGGRSSVDEPRGVCPSLSDDEWAM
ncbi:hypothetical protein AB1Y20_006396 [Prymnesium parvum]|uniref:Uncharacterized protein n=1 Tax=Prymnesium parvum TaxID=97485 RepID=A0AB34J2J5_PRYPA